MRSVVQEASTIGKAIEQGLTKAGNPKDFSIKVLEYPERNFFGLTVKPAKIALYYDERVRKTHEPHSMPPSEKSEQHHGRDTERVQREPERLSSRTREGRDGRERDRPSASHARSLREDRNEGRSETGSGHRRSYRDQNASSSMDNNSHENSSFRERDRDRDEVELTPKWSPETMQHAKEWLTRVLTEMHRLVPFSITADEFHLKITLDRSLFDDPEKERRTLASLSLLILETCKHACKVNLRGHKVVLTHK